MSSKLTFICHGCQIDWSCFCRSNFTSPCFGKNGSLTHDVFIPSQTMFFKQPIIFLTYLLTVVLQSIWILECCVNAKIIDIGLYLFYHTVCSKLLLILQNMKWQHYLINCQNEKYVLKTCITMPHRILKCN